MRTIMSWHLDVDKEATREGFLSVVCNWLVQNHRFTLPANLCKLQKEQERVFFTGKDSATFLCTATRDEIFTSVYYSRHNEITNCSWVVDMAYVEKKSTQGSYIVANLRKKELSKNAEFKYQEHFEIRTPSVFKTLIDSGIASLESENGDVSKYPTLYINEERVTEEELSVLEKYSTICHLCKIKPCDNWSFKISFPRLSYEVEYYDNGCELEPSQDKDLRRRYLPKSFGLEHLSPVVDNLFSMVNEGMGNYSEVDRDSILKIYETNKKRQRVPITDELAIAIKEKRVLCGFSQGELAKYASSEEHPITGLVISRIEQIDKDKKLIQKIEINKLNAIEYALGLEKDYLVSIALGNTKREEKKAIDFPKFCSNCGHKIVLPTDED